MRLAMLVGLGLVAAPVAAQDPLPDFATCMDRAVARAEDAIRRADGAFDYATTRDVTYCGTVGIVRCDRGPDPIACQHALARDQDALAEAVRATLPDPRAAMTDWPESLYPALHALAHGRSAGPDCAGAPPVMQAWCGAREANRRLGTAVLAWQLARHLGAAPAATAAGWADPPAPARPVAREAPRP